MSRITITIGVVLFSLSCLFGYLSYGYSKRIGELEQSLKECIGNNKALVLEVEKATKSCSIVDAISTENTTEQKALDTKKEKIVEKVESLPSLPKKEVRQEVKNEAQNDVVDIDARLPAELVGLLNEAYYHSVQEQSTPNP